MNTTTNRPALPAAAEGMLRRYAVAIETDSGGSVDWFEVESVAEAEYTAATADPALADHEVSLFAFDVRESTDRDDITSIADALMWSRAYQPLRWRPGPGHTAAPHKVPAPDPAFPRATA